MLLWYNEVSRILWGGGALFGYVRPQPMEMKLRDYAYYRAVYCGVCREMANEAGALFPLSLRYDFVFLALARLLLSEESGKIAYRRCALHPVKKRPFLVDTRALSDTARLAAVLTHYSVEDTARDERGAKRMAAKMIMPTTARYRKKAIGKAEADGEMAALDHIAKEKMEELAILEAKGEMSPDTAAEPFAALLADVFAYGYEAERARIARVCGRAVGRFVYLCDAVDDAIKDEKSGSYNPFVYLARAEGKTVGSYLSEQKERIEATLTLACRDAYQALLLLPMAERHPAWSSLENLLLIGMPEMARRVAEHPGEALDGRDLGAMALTNDQMQMNDGIEDIRT